MALTVRYVAAGAAQGLDGLTLGNAMNINDALRNPSGNSEYRILRGGLHVVTGSIVPVPTGLLPTSPAYFVGYSDISGLFSADYQVSGNRQRIDHMPQIFFSGAINYNNGVANYQTFANLVVSGTVNGTLMNFTSANTNIFNCYVQNASTGSSAQAVAVGFRSNVVHSTLITSGIVNAGIALNLANSVNSSAYRCYVSAPSGVGIMTNNACVVSDCIFDTCKRGIRLASSNAGDTYNYGNTFINCVDYCMSHRNAATTHSGAVLSAGNFAYNSGPLLALVDSNGVIDLTYTTGQCFVTCNNFTVNTQAATGNGNYLLLSSPTGNISATNLFADVSGHDLRFTARATGIYDRNPFSEGAGATSLANAIRTPRLS